jgi:hypothetical protein
LKKFQNSLEGHIRTQLIKFFIGWNGCPITKCRINYNNSNWLSKEGGGDKLWQEDLEEKALWPSGKHVALSTWYMKNLDDT